MFSLQISTLVIIAENLEQGIYFVILLCKAEVTAAIVGTDIFFFNREEVARREDLWSRCLWRQ